MNRKRRNTNRKQYKKRNTNRKKYRKKTNRNKYKRRTPSRKVRGRRQSGGQSGKLDGVTNENVPSGMNVHSNFTKCSRQCKNTGGVLGMERACAKFDIDHGNWSGMEKQKEFFRDHAPYNCAATMQANRKYPIDNAFGSYGFVGQGSTVADELISQGL